MEHINNKDDVIQKFLTKIHENLRQINYYNNPNLDIIRKVSFLIDELLSDDDMRNQFEKALIHMENSEIKISVFSMIRNVLAHFPFYEEWNEIYLNEEILNWNNAKGKSIYKFFSENNAGKILSYDVYFKLSHSDKKIKHTINITIPAIKDGFYMKDFISLGDLYYTFFLIDHLLEKQGIATQIYHPPSI